MRVERHFVLVSILYVSKVSAVIVMSMLYYVYFLCIFN